MAESTKPPRVFGWLRWLRRIWRGTLRPDAHLSRAEVIAALYGDDGEIRTWLDATPQRHLRHAYPWGAAYYIWAEVQLAAGDARQAKQVASESAIARLRLAHGEKRGVAS